MQPADRLSFVSTGSKYRQKNKKQLIQFLTSSFGFSSSLANLIIGIHDCSDLTQLMGLFVLDQNNQYAHVFIPTSDNVEIARCKICDQNRTYHVHEISWEQLRQFQQQFSIDPLKFEEELLHHNSFRQDDLEIGNSNDLVHSFFSQGHEPEFSKQLNIHPQAQSKTCCICYVNIFNEDDLVHMNGTIHEICLNCMNEYLKQQILNLRIEHLVCPHCSDPLTPEIVKQYVSNTLFQKYQAFTRNIEIQKNPNLKWCPNPKCSVVISTTKHKSKVKCPKCGTMVCMKCNQEAHPKKSCDQALKSIYKDLQNASDIQKCKKCKALVEKVSGCNHMTCRVCKYEWCWLCGSTYSDIHFSPLNPLGCAGMQNRNISAFSKCKIYILRVFMVLGFIILFPIVVPLIMLFCGPVILFQFLVRHVCRYCGCCVELLIAIICLPLGIALDPFVWIGATIYFLPSLCSKTKEWFQRRRNIIEVSQNEIKRKLLEQSEAVVAQQ